MRGTAVVPHSGLSAIAIDRRCLISGARIAIGPLILEDASSLFRWINDAEAARRDYAYRPMHWNTFETWFNAPSDDKSRVRFAVRVIGEARIVGFGFVARINPVNRAAELGIRIGEARDRGKRYGGDAVRCLSRYCWNDLNLKRVSLTTFADNLAAIRAFEAAGFVREAVTRGAAFIDGRWLDVCIPGAPRAPTRSSS